MRPPISRRLLCCAELVPPCDSAADVGTDHGYLGIHLLLTGRCRHVIAADLREKPLASARANAAAFGIPELPYFPSLRPEPSPGEEDVPSPARPKPSPGEKGVSPLAHPKPSPGEEGVSPLAHPKPSPAGEGAPVRTLGRMRGAPSHAPDRETEPGCGACGMSFVRSDGLHNIEPGSFEVLVLAGMGGDLIARILDEAPWLDGGPYTLILQPQSAANDLRRRLGERAWSIDRERLARDGRFLYSVMAVRPGKGRALTPGEQYVSPALRAENDPLYPAYLARTRRALELTVSGIAQSADPEDLARAAYYQAALEEVLRLPPSP